MSIRELGPFVSSCQGGHQNRYVMRKLVSSSELTIPAPFRRGWGAWEVPQPPDDVQEVEDGGGEPYKGYGGRQPRL